MRGRPTAFPLDPLKRQLMLKHAVFVVLTLGLYCLQLPAVPPGLRLRMGAQQKPHMVHVRLHAFPPSECPRADHIHLQLPPGNGVTLRTAKL